MFPVPVPLVEDSFLFPRLVPLTPFRPSVTSGHTLVEQSCLRSMITETHEDHGLVDSSYYLSPVWPLNRTIEGGTKNLNISRTDP